MKRREFIAGLGAAATGPLTARAQQTRIPVIGVLDLGSPRPGADRYIAALLKGLADAGYVVGNNLAIEVRWADYDELGQLGTVAAELVRLKVAVIVAIDTDTTAKAAKSATSTIPIIMAAGTDPVKYGLVESLNRPGGNVTGVTTLTTALFSKQLDLLAKIAPDATTLAFLCDSAVEDWEDDVARAASALQRHIEVIRGADEDEIDSAFATFVDRQVGALLVGPYLAFLRAADRIFALAAQNKIPACYMNRNWVARGGLMSYGIDPIAVMFQLGSQYIAPILRGAKPADLPVQQPTKFELVINLKTAKALGIDVPPTLLAFADEVIE